MGNQQPSLEQRKVQRLSERSRAASDWRFEVVSARITGEDIVQPAQKCADAMYIAAEV